MEYFGLIVSSHIEKSKSRSKYKYNEELYKNKLNHLSYDSIVKCDKIYQIPKENIRCKIGTINVDDYIRFMKAYKNYIHDKTTA